MPVSSYIDRIRRSAGSSTLPPFPKPGCRAVKGPVPSSHSRCYVLILYSEITVNVRRTKGFPHILVASYALQMRRTAPVSRVEGPLFLLGSPRPVLAIISPNPRVVRRGRMPARPTG